jgi:nitroimidazol reductase NimA-like FMN-containing flavoprotein (pyridoxamine 5'-phosphate oxidase superfamily)
MTSYYNKVLEPTSRTTLRRRAGRAKYDRAAIDAILDEGLVGHLGICDPDGQPVVLPVTYARLADDIVFHGAALGRLLGTLAQGVPVCFTVTLLDGLVLARSAFHHSMNYRSLVVLGEARALRDTEAKLAALTAVVDHVAPGRSADVRGPSRQELAATEVATLPLREASAKIRTGPPVDAAEDYALPCWAGELPLSLAAGAPLADARCAAPTPAYIDPYRRIHAKSIAA